MSSDQQAQILKYVSAMAREVGEFRQEFYSFRDDMNAFRGETNARLTNIEGRLTGVESRLVGIEQEQRRTRKDINLVSTVLLDSRGETEELRERVEVLEEKKA